MICKKSRQQSSLWHFHFYCSHTTEPDPINGFKVGEICCRTWLWVSIIKGFGILLLLKKKKKSQPIKTKQTSEKCTETSKGYFLQQLVKECICRRSFPSCHLHNFCVKLEIVIQSPMEKQICPFLLQRCNYLGLAEEWTFLMLSLNLYFVLENKGIRLHKGIGILWMHELCK